MVAPLRLLLASAAMLAGQSAVALEPNRFTPVSDGGRITLIEENDALSPRASDRHYTQGFQATYLSPALDPRDAWQGRFPEIAGLMFDSSGVQTRRFEVSIGQTIFTPRRLQQIPPDPFDRPFAGWLYGGLGFLQETNGRMLERLEINLGVVGPSSQAEQVQSGFHTLLGSARVSGWRYQLKDEPGVVVSYERKWRFDQALTDSLSANFIPEVGASFGNVYTYGQVGALVRIGQNLEADYGPARIRPAMSGTSWFDGSRMVGPFGWYLFASAQVRGVAQNVTLDGNSWDSNGPSVAKNPFVGDLSGGVSLFWTNAFKVDFQVTVRSKEFKGQRDLDQFGGVAVSFALP